MFNPLYKSNSLPLDINRIYKGYYTQHWITKKYMIKSLDDIQGIHGLIMIDRSENTSGLSEGKHVYFNLVEINGKYYANNITT